MEVLGALASLGLDLSATRPPSGAGATSAESGDKLRSLRRPFHPGVQYMYSFSAIHFAWLALNILVLDKLLTKPFPWRHNSRR
jgi:hypothetical protein